MKIPTCRIYTNLLDQNHSSTKMSQSTRKRQHQQHSPAVKEEQQEHEVDTHLNGAAAGISASQSSLSNFENSNNTIGSAVDGGNGGDDINGLKVKMAALEV
jgi:hypothetical protein